MPHRDPETDRIPQGPASNPPRRPSAPELDREAWRRLLTALDPDPIRAGHRYEHQRRVMIARFRWRGLAEPEALADRAFDRAARRLRDGEVIRGDMVHYLNGVARRIAAEAARAAWRWQSLADAPGPLAAPPDDDELARLADRVEEGLARLPPAARDLLLRYHRGDGRDRIDLRRRLADELGIPLTVLRLRVHRLRARLAALCHENE